MGIPTLGMTCSHVGNEAFPRWEQSVPPKGMTFPDFTRHFFSLLTETVDDNSVVVLKL